MSTITIKLALADDHPAVLAGIKHELAGVPTIDIVGTARNSTEIIELLRRTPCDILVTDYAMPGGEYGDGMTLLSFLRRHYPALKIIVFTTIDNAAIVSEVSKLGIQAVLNKVGEVAHLIYAINAVYAGASYFSPGAAQQELRIRHGRATRDRVRQLTLRETEVIRLYLSGLSIKEIAAVLNRAKQTVSAQKKTAMRKLGIERNADLFRFANETGLIISTSPMAPGDTPTFLPASPPNDT
jgi:two-component system capsular synthesis response regulator RcsB